MEHPGRIWNSIECTCNRFLEKLVPRQVLRWGWVLGHSTAALYVLILCLGACLGYIICIGLPVQKLCREKIYDADSVIVNPALEGKLVRLSGQLTSTHKASDPLTGIQVQAPWICRSILFEHQVPFRILKELKRKEIFYATEWHLGAYCIRHYTPPSHFNSRKELTAEQLQFTQPKENWQVTPPAPGESDITLTAPGSNEPIIFHIYCNTTEPVYIVARQCGNELLMDDPEASFHYNGSWGLNDSITLDIYTIICLILGTLAHFGLLCLALSCIRSAIWHATQGRNILRLPLWQVAISMVVISCCLTIGLFLLTDGNTTRTLVPGLIFLVAGLSSMAVLAHTWLHAPAQRG